MMWGGVWGWLGCGVLPLRICVWFVLLFSWMSMMGFVFQPICFEFVYKWVIFFMFLFIWDFGYVTCKPSSLIMVSMDWRKSMYGSDECLISTLVSSKALGHASTLKLCSSEAAIIVGLHELLAGFHHRSSLTKASSYKLVIPLERKELICGWSFNWLSTSRLVFLSCIKKKEGVHNTHQWPLYVHIVNKVEYWHDIIQQSLFTISFYILLIVHY